MGELGKDWLRFSPRPQVVTPSSSRAPPPPIPSPSPPLTQVALWGAALIVFVFANFVKLQVGSHACMTAWASAAHA